MMEKPKMILFDYGHTLIYEPDVDFHRGEEALFKYVKSNKNNLTSKQVSDFSLEIYEGMGVVRDMDFEIHEWQHQRFLYEYLGIELTISLPEAEIILWENASPGECMPNIEKLLKYLDDNNIRSGVISNIGFSGVALAKRINRLIPKNKFEFIIASSEYMFRKPSKMIFELALRKAGLEASEVWFCGDSIKADVEGSSAALMFPIWYENNVIDNPWHKTEKGTIPEFEHLHINDWQELIDVLRDTDG